MTYREDRLILSKLSRNKKAVAPILAGIGRGLASAGKSAGRVAVSAKNSIGTKLSKTAAETAASIPPEAMVGAGAGAAGTAAVMAAATPSAPQQQQPQANQPTIIIQQPQQKTTDESGKSKGMWAALAERFASKPQTTDKMPFSELFILLMSIAMGGVMYKVSGGDIMLILPALIPILGFIIIILLLYSGRYKYWGWIGSIIMILLISATAYGCTTHTAPYLGGAYASGKLSLEFKGAAQTGEEVASSTMKDAIDSFKKSYKQSMAAATGQRIEGDVDQTVKEEIGIEILEPYLPNDEKLTLKEAKNAEVTARIKAFDPKKQTLVTLSCYMKEPDSLGKVMTTTSQEGPDPNPGTKFTIKKDKLSGYNFDNEVTCYPRPTTCGNHIITISADSDHLRTDAQLINYVMDSELYEKKLQAYAEANREDIRSESQLNSVIQKIYPELAASNSISDKGVIKVLMATQKAPVIPVDKDTALALRVGVENMKQGWIMGINSVIVTIPEFFVPQQDACDAWSKQGGTLILKQDVIESLNMKQLVTGEQKLFPSCRLVPNKAEELLEPRPATFLVAVDYNYMLRKEYKLEITNETGGKECVTAATSTGTNSTQSSKGAIIDSALPDAIKACEGKKIGDQCQQTGYCSQMSYGLSCVPQCLYYASKGLTGLTSSYNCITPQDSCDSATIKKTSCKIPWLSGSWTCCIPKDGTATRAVA